MKYLFIIPGFGETGKESCYKEISKFAKSKGFKSIVISVVWDRNTLSTWIKEVRKILNTYSKEELRGSIILGFSFGALISQEIAKDIIFNKVISCSCSPYFKENLKYIPKEVFVFFGKKRMKDFENYSINSYKKNKIRNFMALFGEKDWDIGQKTSKKISEYLEGTFQIIAETEHELSPLYIENIQNKIE